MPTERRALSSCSCSTSGALRGSNELPTNNDHVCGRVQLSPRATWGRKVDVDPAALLVGIAALLLAARGTATRTSPVQKWIFVASAAFAAMALIVGIVSFVQSREGGGRDHSDEKPVPAQPAVAPSSPATATPSAVPDGISRSPADQAPNSVTGPSTSGGTIRVESTTTPFVPPPVAGPAPAAPPRAAPATILDGSINEPPDNSRVPHEVTAHGLVTFAVPYEEAWLLVEVPAVRRYYPGPSLLTLGAAGAWMQSLHVGGAHDSSGTAYLLHLVALNRSAAQRFADYRSHEEQTNEIIGFTRAELNEVGVKFLDTHKVLRN